MYFVNHFIIDFDKVKDIEDIKTILKSIHISFEQITPELEPFCKYVNKQTGEEVKI